MYNRILCGMITIIAMLLLIIMSATSLEAYHEVRILLGIFHIGEVLYNVLLKVLLVTLS